MSKESAPVMAGVPSTRYVMLDSLTILRGPAALFVFFYHTRWAHVVPSASVGYVGVALFFVLSGFVLTWSYKPADGAKKFYLRRCIPAAPFLFCTCLGNSRPDSGSPICRCYIKQPGSAPHLGAELGLYFFGQWGELVFRLRGFFLCLYSARVGVAQPPLPEGGIYRFGGLVPADGGGGERYSTYL